MDDGDLELNLMFYWVKELKQSPSDFYKLSRRELAFIYAVVSISSEEHKKAMSKIKK